MTTNNTLDDLMLCKNLKGGVYACKKCPNCKFCKKYSELCVCQNPQTENGKKVKCRKCNVCRFELKMKGVPDSDVYLTPNPTMEERMEFYEAFEKWEEACRKMWKEFIAKCPEAANLLA